MSHFFEKLQKLETCVNKTKQMVSAGNFLLCSASGNETLIVFMKITIT